MKKTCAFWGLRLPPPPRPRNQTAYASGQCGGSERLASISSRARSVLPSCGHSRPKNSWRERPPKAEQARAFPPIALVTFGKATVTNIVHIRPSFTARSYGIPPSKLS
jgi:hypothetical protein